MATVHEDILRQPKSLAQIVDYHFGTGSNELKAAAEWLSNAPTIILTGMGASLFACIPLQYNLGSRGRSVVLIETAELLHYQAEICRGAVIVVVSRSGDTIEISRLLDCLQGSDAKIIGVTNEASGSLAKRAPHVLLVTNPRDELVALQSYTGQLTTLMLLGALSCGEPEAAWRSAFDRILPVFENVIESHAQSIDDARGFFENSACVYLLGRGPSFATCNQGALLFNEVAKYPSIAMPAGQFRHGPVEVVDESFRGIVFAPEGKTRELNLSLARDLASFGGHVYVVGPARPLDAQREVSFWEVPSGSRLSTPLLEVIPLQIAAYQVAEWRGIPTGKFRYVATVTSDEASFPVARK